MKKLLLIPFMFITLNCYSQLVTSEDTLRYQIRNMQWDFENYADQSALGTGLYIGGLAIGGSAFLVDDQEAQVALAITGGALVLIGTLVRFTASRHLRHASQIPIRFGQDRRRQ